MIDGKITLRLRNVAYDLEEGDDAGYESVDESRYHGVDVGILLTGEDGIAYQIYCDQMNDLDCIAAYRVTKNIEKGLLKDVTQSLCGANSLATSWWLTSPPASRGLWSCAVRSTVYIATPPAKTGSSSRQHGRTSPKISMILPKRKETVQTKRADPTRVLSRH